MDSGSSRRELEERTSILEKKASRRQEMDAEFIKQKELLDRILDAALFGIFLLENRTIRWANRVGVEMFGYEKEEELVGRISEILYSSKEEFHRVGRLAYETYDKDSPVEIDVNCKRRDGTVFFGHMKLKSFEQEDPQKKAVVTFSDITEQKGLEKELRFQKAYFESLFTQLPEALAVFDYEGRITGANPEFSNLFGYSLEELIGEDISRLVAPRDRLEEAISIRKRVTSGETIRLETVRRRKDGNTFQVSMQSSPVIVEGNHIGFYIIYRDVSNIKETEDRLRKLATTDPLTGLFNRRHFRDLAEKEIHRAERYGRPLCLLMIDIDYFKTVNDTYGHDTGDQVLRHLAEIGLDTLRIPDVFGRIGGEEFAILLPDTDSKGGEKMAERLRKRIEDTPFLTQTGQIPFTISGGISAAPPHSKTVDQLLKEADEAMYRAKRTGRNRIC